MNGLPYTNDMLETIKADLLLEHNIEHTKRD